MSGDWWWFLLLGIAWTLFGMFVLSYRVGSLTAVAAFVGFVVSLFVAWYLIVFRCVPGNGRC